MTARRDGEWTRLTLVAVAALPCIAGISLPPDFHRAFGAYGLPLYLCGYAFATVVFASLVHERALIARGPHRTVVLLLEILLAVGPVAVFGAAWGPVCGFLPRAAPAHGRLPRLLVAPLALAGAAATGATAGLDGGGLLRLLGLGAGTALAVHGVVALADRVEAESFLRHQTVGRAVAAERDRFSRDLHDLIGYNVSAIAIKSELTRALVDENAGAAHAELADIVSISRHLLDEVRTVAHDAPRVRFGEEVDSVRRTLAAAGIAVRLDVRIAPIPDRLDGLLGTVLREAVTNVLRHSRARHCRIAVHKESDRIRLEVANDGAREGTVGRLCGAVAEKVTERRQSRAADRMPGRARGRASGGDGLRAGHGPAGGRAGKPLDGVSGDLPGGVPGSLSGDVPGGGAQSVPGEGPAAERNRLGLRNLAERVAEVGGRLSVSTDGTGWFVLVAECPRQPDGERPRGARTSVPEQGGVSPAALPPAPL
ncbi:sensor histidine kinase [Streptomyces nodosus]|uniref:sensor histidine kinase n=1 Tax=Streptomyces nodosus TaxID=40318 RepID=UPI00382240D1